MSTSDTQPGADEGRPTPVEPTTGESPYTTRGAAARAAAAHAAERPAPTPPDGGPQHATTPATSDPTPASPAPTSPAPASPVPASTAPTTPVVAPRAADVPPTRASTTTSTTDATTAPVEPVAPRTTGFGGHVLGALVGLLLGLLAISVALTGQGRILGVQAEGWDASLDVLGITLVTLGAVLLGAIVWLGLWSAAVPITAGIITTAFGSVFLFAPGIARTNTMDALATVNSRDTVSQATVAGTSGTMLLVGFLVLVVGLALSLARRRGRVLGEFRERNRPT